MSRAGRAIRAARPRRRSRRRGLLLWAATLATLTAWLGMGAVRARAEQFVDGISDQHLQWWTGWGSPTQEGTLAQLFQESWVQNGHIKLARYVGQWDALTLNEAESGRTDRQGFERWVSDAGGHLGLSLDLSLTNYIARSEPICLAHPSDCKPSVSEYEASLAAMLTRAEQMRQEGNGRAISYVEAWNEPNGQGGLKDAPALAADYTSAASQVCAAQPVKCTVIAGNFFDGSGGPAVIGYIRAYERRLAKLHTEPAIWGIHPYDTVQQMNAGIYSRVVGAFPSYASQTWITEVGAYRCHGSAEGVVYNSEAEQAERARWLVDTLLPTERPAHTFYYEWYEYEPQASECEKTEDTSLFSSQAGEPLPVPAPAASFIYDDGQAPLALTAPAARISEKAAELRGVVYPQDTGASEYYFQYGTSSTYGSVTPPVAIVPQMRFEWAYGPISGLAPGQTYHYRLAARSATGTSYGPERTFTTESATPSAARAGPAPSPTEPPSWLLGRSEASSDLAGGQGTIELADTGLELHAQCATALIAALGPTTAESAQVVGVRSLSGATLLPCASTSPGWCAAGTVQLEATGLPWQAQLLDVAGQQREDSSNPEVALRILDGEWRISCSFMGSTITDTCDGQMTARVQNTDGGVAIDLAASESAMSCAGASLGIGSIGGQVRIASAEAGTPLRVDGARASP